MQKILVAKGILPYSNGSQLTELENSEAYIASSSVLPEPHRTVNTSSTINTYCTTYEESTKQQQISNRIYTKSTTEFLVSSTESTEKDTSNTINVKSTAELLVSCVESTEQHISNTINAPCMTESLVYCQGTTEQHTSNTINIQGTTESLAICTESTEHNLNTMESVSNIRTNVSLMENEVYEGMYGTHIFKNIKK